jgi:hypothetical protein
MLLLLFTDSNKLKGLQRQFAALCYNRFSQDVEYDYDNLLEKLNLLTLHISHHHIDALFLINIFSGAKCCLSPGNSQHPTSCSEHTYVTLPCSLVPPAMSCFIDAVVCIHDDCAIAH